MHMSTCRSSSAAGSKYFTDYRIGPRHCEQENHSTTAFSPRLYRVTLHQHGILARRMGDVRAMQHLGAEEKRFAVHVWEKMSFLLINVTQPKGCIPKFQAAQRVCNLVAGGK